MNKLTPDHALDMTDLLSPINQPMADVQVVENAKTYVDETLKNCWPPFDKFNVADSERVIVNTPSTARDGLHYGPGHHERFAKQLHKAFYTKFK